VRMRNPPSVVWLDRMGNMALVVQITLHLQIMKLGTLISQNCSEDRAWRYVCTFRNQFYYYRFIISMVIRLMTTEIQFQRVNNSVCLRNIFIVIQYKQKEPNFESTQRPIYLQLCTFSGWPEKLLGGKKEKDMNPLEITWGLSLSIYGS
jgi:hypothetical protein